MRRAYPPSSLIFPADHSLPPQSTWALWIVSLSSSLGTIANLLPFFLVAMEAFNGSLMPYAQMPYGYRWLYWVSPFQHYVRSMLGELLHNLPVECADFEVVSFATPPGTTCGAYAQEYLTRNVGYLLDPTSTTLCGFCPMSSGDDFLASLNISHSDRWSSLSILAFYSLSNILIAYLLVFFPPRVTGWVAAVWSRVFGSSGGAKGAEEVAQEAWVAELRRDREAAELVRGTHDAFA